MNNDIAYINNVNGFVLTIKYWNVLIYQMKIHCMVRYNKIKAIVIFQAMAASNTE